MFHSNAKEWIYNAKFQLCKTLLSKHYAFFKAGLIIYIHAQTNAVIADSLEQWKTKQIPNL